MDTENHTPIIISRKDAQAQGLKRYYTGTPCKRGHLSERYASSGDCIICALEKAAIWANNNPEKAARNKETWAVQNREKAEASWKKYKDANPDRVAKHKREWANRNPDYAKIKYAKNAAQISLHRAENPIQNRLYRHNRRARERNATGSHTVRDVLDLYASQKGLCVYCNIPVGDDYHVDHIVPLVKGGSNGKENLQITCPTCNLKKGRKDHATFTQRQAPILRITAPA